MAEPIRTLRVDDPYTGETACELPLAGEREAMAAVDRAAAAQRGGGRVPVAERVERVRRFCVALAARREEVARDISRQMGKPLAEAEIHHATRDQRGRRRKQPPRAGGTPQPTGH